MSAPCRWAIVLVVPLLSAQIVPAGDSPAASSRFVLKTTTPYVVLTDDNGHHIVLTSMTNPFSVSLAAKTVYPSGFSVTLLCSPTGTDTSGDACIITPVTGTIGLGERGGGPRYTLAAGDSVKVSALDSKWIVTPLSLDVVSLGADPSGVSDSTDAFTRALASSSTVSIPCGKFRVSNITLATNYQNFKGSGPCTLLSPSSDAVGPITVSGSATNVRIHDFSLEGAAHNERHPTALITTDGSNPPAHLSIYRLYFTSTGPSTHWVRGILFDGVKHSEVSHCHFEGNTGTQVAVGVFLMHSSDYNSVIRNDFISTPNATKAHIAIKTGSSFNAVTHNHLTGGGGANPPAHAGGAGILLGAFSADEIVHDNLISDNVVEGFNGVSAEALEAGIQVGGRVQNNTISNNIIRNNSRHGIVVEDDGTTEQCQRNTISDNSIYGNSRYGIWQRGCLDNVISRNKIYDNSRESSNAYDGICIDWNGTTLGRATVTENIVSGTSHRYSISTTAHSSGTTLVNNCVGPAGTGATNIHRGTAVISGSCPQSR